MEGVLAHLSSKGLQGASHMLQGLCIAAGLRQLANSRSRVHCGAYEGRHGAAAAAAHVGGEGTGGGRRSCQAAGS